MKANDYIESQSMATHEITNDMLRCKDCAYRNDSMPTALCNIFTTMQNRKPNKVLLSGDCAMYKKAENV